MIGKCRSCGTERRMHRDHIVPKSLGGSDNDSNIQYLCANCHEDKTVAQNSEVQKASSARPAVAAAHKARMQQYWADPAHRKQQSERLNKPETRERLSQSLGAAYCRPGVREHLSRVKKAHWQNPKYRAKTLEALRKSARTPESRARKSAAAFKREALKRATRLVIFANLSE